MSYTCQQEIIVIEDPKSCNEAFDKYILEPALQFIGLDCEWNTNRPVSLLQIATPTIVLLVRICKLNFTLPENVKLVLEDPTICKVGVNIENDSEKLGEDCFCKIKNWVDLRHVAIRSKSWGPSIVEQVENLEYNLKFYDQKDPNSESAKQANTKRICWCPKMGLESLISDCLDRTLPKNTSARWSDDWESDRLQSNQRTYAANDATASLDIFVALVYSSVSGKQLPFDMTFDVAEIVGKYSRSLEEAVKGLYDVQFMQTKEDMDRIYRLIEATNPDLDIRAYYTKPSSKSQKQKNEKKEFYKKKAREAATQKSGSSKNATSAQAMPVALPKNESEPLPTDTASNPSQDLDSSRGSHTFREITQALAHTKPNSKTLTENFLTMQSDRDKMSLQDVRSKNFPHLPILFYFKHTADKKAALIPGYSYGRGSIPPTLYRRFRTSDSETQTESGFKVTDFKKVFPSYKPVIISELERSAHVNTDYSFIFRQPPVNKPLIKADKRGSPQPNYTTDDEQGSESSCTSSNYQSSVSKNSKSKGRGRGRGKPTSSIGSSRNVDSDSDLNLKKGRGRGRGVVISETRAPNSRADADSETEKVVFNSYDIRYQNADDADNRPTDLNLEDRSRKHTTSSVSSAATLRQQVSETTILPEVTTPTNSFANPHHKSTFEEAFFEAGSTYSSYSVQDLLTDDPPENHTTTRSQEAFKNRPYSASNRGSYSGAVRSGNLPPARQKNPYSSKPSSRPDHINQTYEYKTDVFRQAVERGSNSLHVGVGTGERPQREEVTFDWSKFREENSIATPSESSHNNTGPVVDIDLSDDSFSSSD